MHEKLNEPIPLDAIQDKDGLSYIAGWWVAQQMNEIFGPLGWSRRTVEARVVPGTDGSAFHIYEGKRGTSKVAHAHATVAIDIHLPEGVITRQASAGGTGRGADPLRDAIGEAETDAFKRAAAQLGPRLGLELYIPAIYAVERAEEAIRILEMEPERRDDAMKLANFAFHGWVRATKKPEHEKKISKGLKDRWAAADGELAKRLGRA